MFSADSSDCNDLFYRIGLIADNHVSSFGIKEILENAPLVSIFVEQCIRLHLTHSDV